MTNTQKLNILLTGGAGYVGSHTLIELFNLDVNCIVLDNFINANKECIRRCETIVKRTIPLFDVDLQNFEEVLKVFQQFEFYAVIHFAGLKAVGESVQKPLLYYENNIYGTINLLKAMNETGCKRIIFSSSATVYGSPSSLPITEGSEVGKCSNPYGKTKYFIEEIISDHMKSINGSFIHLRYFNPVGAHESGIIGESPKDIPNNLFPYISQVAVGVRPELSVYGDDYDTHDGTGVRDYIHVVDLAQGHVSALKYMIKHEKESIQKVYNLGTGKGYSVLDAVKAFEKASGKKILYKIVGRRPGDVSTVYSDVSLAKKELEWTPNFGLDKMCEDTWRFQKANPNGYENN